MTTPDRPAGPAPENVLRAAAEWIWMPPGTELGPAEDYLLVAMPTYVDTPTQVLRTTSSRPPETLVAEVRDGAARALAAQPTRPGA